MGLSHTLTIRQVQGHLIVSSKDVDDPIQLVQQLDKRTLKVHLKNGASYDHIIKTNELDNLILEMFGYRRHMFEVSVCLWNDGKARVKIRDPEQIRHNLCVILQNSFTYNSYIAGLIPSLKLVSEKASGVLDYFVWHGEMLMRDELLDGVCTAISENVAAETFCTADYPRLSCVDVTYFTTSINGK